MRNLRKLTAAVLAVALVLTSMTAVFAADSAKIANADKAATLKDLGLYAGTDATDVAAGLDGALTTQDSLIFLAKLFGYNEAATKLTADQVTQGLAKFDDAASISDYAKNVVAYSATNGILSGSTKDGKFFVGAKDTVTAARFATFMLKQMGIAVADYKASVAKLAETKGSKVDATITGDLTRDVAVGMMYGALTAEKASGKTVIADIVGDNADLKAKAEKAGLLVNDVVTTDVAVESVKALNAKQIQIVFNQEMNKDSVQTETFYEVYDNGSSKATELGGDSAVLGDDGKTVTITLNKAVNDKLTNSSEAKVVVKKDIKAKSGAKLAKNSTTEKVLVEDGLIPTVTKADHTGERNIKLEFSEPVYDKGTDATIANANFKVVSGTYEYFVQSADLDNNVINLTLGTNLIEGPIVVTVNNAGADKTDAIVDYAGYAVFKSSTTFNYVKNTEVSVVTVKEAKTDFVTLAFSKPVKATKAVLYHSVKNSIYKAEMNTNNKYVSEYKFVFKDADETTADHPLPQGTVKLFLVNDTSDDGYKIVDGYGIKVPDQTLTADIVVDETAPTFSGGTFDTNVKIYLAFDEELSAKEAVVEDNYTVKKVSGTDTLDFDAVYPTPEKENTVTLNFANVDKLEDNTEYIVTIKKAEDTAGNKTTKEYTYTFTTGDNTAPKVKDTAYATDENGNYDSAKDQCYAVNGDGKIYITFTEPMNDSQMLDKNNYMVNTTGAAFVALGDDDKVTKISDRKICIDLDKAIDLNYAPSVKIAPIMDLAGKRLYDSVDSKTVYSIGGESVVVSNAKLIAKNKVKVTFNTQIKSFNNNDISFVFGSSYATQSAVRIASVESQVVNDDGNTEVLLVLDKDITTDGTYTAAATATTPAYNRVKVAIKTANTTGSESVSGTKLVANDTVDIEDKTAPEVLKYNHDGKSETEDVALVYTSMTGNKQAKGTKGFIFIECSEKIEFASLSVLSFTVKGYSVKGIGLVGDNDNDNVIFLDVEADDSVTTYPTVTQVYNITDINNNALASGSTWTVRAAK